MATSSGDTHVGSVGRALIVLGFVAFAWYMWKLELLGPAILSGGAALCFLIALPPWHRRR